MAAAKNKFLTKRYIGFFLAIVVFLLIKFVLPLDSFGSVATGVLRAARTAWLSRSVPS